MRPPDGADRAQLGTGVALAILGTLLVWQASQIPAGGSYATIGAAAAPWFVAALVLLLAALFIGSAWLLRKPPARPAEPMTRRPILVLTGALTLHLALITWTGFIVATTLLFLLTARIFGSRTLARDGAIGLAATLGAFLLFDRVLGYRIGNGLIENLL